MVEAGNSTNEFIPKRELPAWTTNETLITSNPELHHYTNRSGLEGIWKTNSLWATHFSNLSDSSEIVLLKKPLEVALAALFKPQIMQRQRESYHVRRHVAKVGGIEVVARNLAHKSVEAHFVLAITGGKVSPNIASGGRVSPFAEPFICSFCSHAIDDAYERDNGLLSQWRGYGGAGRYALVFDTRQLDDLLALEWQAHYWTKLDIDKVAYFEGSETLENEFPQILSSSAAFMENILNGKSTSNIDLFTPFSRAATLLKHRGFHEEREVRIVACPFSESAFADRGMKNELSGWPPIKDVHMLSNSKKYVALFESLGVTLPIKRIIVGPSADQQGDYEFAQSVVCNQVPIVRSETPFIG
jgi:hypothetical protein